MNSCYTLVAAIHIKRMEIQQQGLWEKIVSPQSQKFTSYYSCVDLRFILSSIYIGDQ